MKVKSTECWSLEILSFKKENDVIKCEQWVELSEVAELRWNGAAELIRLEVPEREKKWYEITLRLTVNQMTNNRKQGSRCGLSVQSGEQSEAAELSRDGPGELISIEAPDKQWTICKKHRK